MPQKLATAPQIAALHSLGASAFGRASRDADLLTLCTKNGCAVDSLNFLTSAQASQLISLLQKQLGQFQPTVRRR